jgi:hypothetical protein
VTPHNQRIVTSRLQPGACGMSPPQSGTAGLRGFRAICRSRPVRCGQRCQPRLPGRCGVSARTKGPVARAAHRRYYRSSWTRGACRCQPGKRPGSTPPPKPMRTGSVPPFPAPPTLTTSLGQGQYVEVSILDHPETCFRANNSPGFGSRSTHANATTRGMKVSTKIHSRSSSSVLTCRSTRST